MKSKKMKTLSKTITIGLIISLFPFYGMSETVVEALETTVASRTSATHDEGVVINGIRWATRNVDMPGTFALYPESLGMFFQWNRRKAWNATDTYVDNWEYDFSAETVNNLCPEGWRVPTHEELQLLMRSGSGWATLDGVNGRVFGRAPYQIFLPAVGWRDSYDGELNLAGREGSYWSSTQNCDENAQHLWFARGSVGTGWANRAHGFSVRCVAE